MDGNKVSFALWLSIALCYGWKQNVLCFMVEQCTLVWMDTKYALLYGRAMHFVLDGNKVCFALWKPRRLCFKDVCCAIYCSKTTASTQWALCITLCSSIRRLYLAQCLRKKCKIYPLFPESTLHCALLLRKSILYGSTLHFVLYCPVRSVHFVPSLF